MRSAAQRSLGVSQVCVINTFIASRQAVWFTTPCRRCYEVKCRGIQAISADGSVNLDRHDACYDTSKSIVIKVCNGVPVNATASLSCKGHGKVLILILRRCLTACY